MEEILMPKLGMAQSYCVIERWLKKEGDKIIKDDELVEVSTDKINYVVEAKSSGYLIKILRNELEEVPTGEAIAFIGKLNETIPESDLKSDNKKIFPETAEKNKGRSGIKISALAKKLAEKNNIDLLEIKGSGPRGRITKKDIYTHLEMGKKSKEIEKDNNGVPVKAKNSEIVFRSSDIKILKENPLTSKRKVIAEKMIYSKQNIPHISQSARADVTKLVELKEKITPFYKKLSFTDFLIIAVAKSLRENIELNSSLIDGKHIIYDDINIGLVTSVPDGLIIPVIHRCDKLSIFDIADKRRKLINKAKQNKLDINNISGGTFTITNLGMFEVRSCTAIIYPPQASILTIGGVYSSPEFTDDEKIENRKVMEFSITEDHRILDGVVGARFLTRLIELLKDPDLISFNE